jgi:hypothetical protein
MGTGRAIRNTLERKAAGHPAQRVAGRLARGLSRRHTTHVRRQITLDDVYAGDLFSALGAIESGVTCMKRGGQMVGLDFARLQRLGDEARDRVYSTAKVKNSRV